MVHDPVGNRPAAVDAACPVVDSLVAPAPVTAPGVDNPAYRWTTGWGLTSADGMSSTIHNPYYRHYQNLNSL